jgi:ribosomal protein S14
LTVSDAMTVCGAALCVVRKVVLNVSRSGSRGRCGEPDSPVKKLKLGWFGFREAIVCLGCGRRPWVGGSQFLVVVQDSLAIHITPYSESSGSTNRSGTSE